jgi:hypothetical protein
MPTPIALNCERCRIGGLQPGSTYVCAILKKMVVM